MGFYGNISNNIKATFQFDKVYSNRKEMDENCTKDGVFVGRYVLVDYNDDTNINFVIAYKIIDSTGECHFHTSLDPVKETRIEYVEDEITETGQVKTGQLLKVIASATYHTEFVKIYSTTYGGADLEQVDIEEYSIPEIWRCDGCEIPQEITINTDAETKINEINNFFSEWEEAESDEDYKQYYLDNIDTILTIPQNVVYPEYISNFLSTLATKNEQIGEHEELILDPVWQDEIHSSFNALMEEWAEATAPGPVYAHFTQELDLQKSSYQLNFSIDSTTYPAIGRGWDSTIWQKISRINETADGREEEIKYIMIAELNTLTPTFDITYEAPTEIPIVPYYDTKDSSNLYYNLHMQPQWGMRIKNYYTLEFSTDTKVYPSDVSGPFVIDSQLQDGTRTYSVFEKVSENGEIKFRRRDNVTKEQILPVGNGVIDDQFNSPLAIYFNKAGFDKYKESNAIIDVEEIQNANSNIIKDQNGNLIDSIMMRPTGLSANSYHNWAQKGKTPTDNLKDPDTYELSIMLPSIGQTFSEIWNLVYGEGVTYDAKGYHLFHPITKTFAGLEEKSKLRNTDISWNSDRGIRAWDGEGNLVTENLHTLAGIINSTHDLMGMIIRDYDGLTIDNNAVKQEPDDPDPIKPRDWDPGKIYYIKDDNNIGRYYMKHKVYTYTPWTSSSKNQYREISNMIDARTAGNIYKEEWQEYPIGSGQRSKQKYVDYYKLHDSSEYIEGAKYVKKISASGQTPEELSFLYETGTYYYATSGEANTATDYVIDNNDSPTLDRHYYYITDEAKESDPVDSEHVSVYHRYSKTFYIPGVFYAYYNGSLTLCEQITLQAVYASLGVSPSDINNVKFYETSSLEKVVNEDEIEVSYIKTEEDGDKVSTAYLPDYEYTLQDESVPKKCYQILYNNGKYYFVKPNEQNNGFEPIVNGEIISIDSNTKTYTTYRYAVEGSDRYYTPWEIYINGFTYSTIDGNYIKEKNYKWTKVEKQSERWVIRDKDNYIPGSKMVEFKNDPSLDTTYYENRFFYVQNNNFKELTRDNLYSVEARWADNIANNYYVIHLVELPYVFYTLDDPENSDITYCYKEGDNYYSEVTPNIPTWGTQKTYYKTSELFEDLEPNEEIYRPNYFYVRQGNTNNYVLSTSYDSNVEHYYEKIGPYVITADTSADVVMDEVQEGTEWRGNTNNVDNSGYVLENGSRIIRIGTRTAAWEAVELKQYGKELNTVNGLILKLNQMMFEDSKNSIEGAIKRIYDTIANFEMIAPYSFTNVVADTGNSISVIGSANTSLNIYGDGNLIQTKTNNNSLIIEHKDPSNQSPLNNSALVNTKLSMGQTFNLNDLVVTDSKGHAILSTAKKLQLPDLINDRDWMLREFITLIRNNDEDSRLIFFVNSLNRITQDDVVIDCINANDIIPDKWEPTNKNYRNTVLDNDLIWDYDTKVLYRVTDVVENYPLDMNDPNSDTITAIFIAVVYLGPSGGIEKESIVQNIEVDENINIKNSYFTDLIIADDEEYLGEEDSTPHYNNALESSDRLGKALHKLDKAIDNNNTKINELEEEKINEPICGIINIHLSSGKWYTGFRAPVYGGQINLNDYEGQWDLIEDDIYKLEISDNENNDFLSIDRNSVIYLQPICYKEEDGETVLDYASLEECQRVWQKAKITDGFDQGQGHFTLITFNKTKLPDTWITLKYTILSNTRIAQAEGSIPQYGS